MPSSPWWNSLPLSLLLVLPTVSAITLDCKHIRADGQSFDLSALGGPKTVHYQTYRAPNIHNTTFTVDVCNALKRTTGVPKGNECPSGTRICAIEQLHNLAEDTVVNGDVIPIAGQYPSSHGRYLDPEPERLKDSKSNSDSKTEGLRLTLHGGKYPDNRTGKLQKAIVEFMCDPEVTGNEGFEDEGKVVRGRADEDEDDEDRDDPELPDLDKGKSLQYISYKDEGDVGTLRMSWKTKFACEGVKDKEPASGGGDKKSSSGWGFFTWFLIVVFLLAAAYIIFGSWLNYNRYGARGWDLIPHGDTIRDLPYVIKDWGSSMMGRMGGGGGGGGGSRGGYSAV